MSAQWRADVVDGVPALAQQRANASRLLVTRYLFNNIFTFINLKSESDGLSN